MNLPNKIVIGSRTFRVEYKDKPSDVDGQGRGSMWGQIDWWDKKIRIYAKSRDSEDIIVTLMHEIVHGILNVMGQQELGKNESFVVDFSDRLVDTLRRNGFLKELE